MKELGIVIDPSPAGTGVSVWLDGVPEAVTAGECRGPDDWLRFWLGIRPFIPEICEGIKAVIVREGTLTGVSKLMVRGLVAVATSKGELTGYLVARLRGAGLPVEIRELSVSDWRARLHGPGLPKGGPLKKAVTSKWVRAQWPHLWNGKRQSAKHEGDKCDCVGIGAAYYGYGHQAIRGEKP